MTLLVTGALLLLGLGLLTADFIHSRTPVEEGLSRGAFGESDREETLDVQTEKERESVTVTVSPQEYTQQEIQSLFRRCSKKLDTLILGENESADRVESDLNLVTQIPDTPVEVSWELSRYDVMTVSGELREEALTKDGTLVELSGTMSLKSDKEQQSLYRCTVAVYKKTSGKKEAFLEKLREAIEKQDEETRKDAYLTLPKEVDGTRVSFYPQMQSRGAAVAGLAVVVGLLLLALEKQREGEQKKERIKRLRTDYPEIVGKLTLLLGAGMTVKRAWRKITADYLAQNGKGETRPAYEEMAQACHEMDSGITEAESYERFGKRCGLQEYIRLGALLSQNLRKGTKGLGLLLKTEADQAFEERKARAKRLGEEAGTKLLAPMFLMLAVVLVMIIVPAFLSVQM